MSEFRHCTNLHVPFDRTDLIFLSQFEHYRIGEPVPGTPTESSEPYTLDVLKLRGIVGLYVTLEELQRPEVAKRTGWNHPEKTLGQEWRP